MNTVCRLSLAALLCALCGWAMAGTAHAQPPADDHGKAAAESAPAEQEDSQDDGASEQGAPEHGTPEHGGDHGGHAADHGEHDPYDLSHNNATPQMTQPHEWRFDLALWTFVVFLALLAILTKFAWGPIAVALERREETIARQIEEARLASEKAATQLREYEARLAAATDEARQIVAGARKEAEIAKERILAEAQEAAQRERERAVADISIAKNQALQEIAQKSVRTAVNLASNIIRREVKPQEHDALISSALDEFSKLN